MKGFKRILLWSLIAIIIQQGIFLYIDKIYLSTSLSIKAEVVNEDNNDKNEVKEIPIRDGVEAVKLSSDGRYVAFLENNKLKVIDSKDNSEKEFTGDNLGEIVYYKWLSDENNIIAIHKVKEKGASYFEPISFDAKKGEARELADFDVNKVRIKVQSTSDTIDDIAFSTATSTLYIKVKKKSGLSDLYYSNIMNQLKKVKSNKLIGKVVVPNTNANAIIEEEKGISILNSKNKFTISNVKNPKLLGTDVNDTLYVGDEENGKIKKIYYAVFTDDNKMWKEIKLNNPVNKEDIVVDYFGKIYVNNRLEGSVLELTTNKTIEYNGNFVQSYSKGIITKDQGKIVKTHVE